MSLAAWKSFPFFTSASVAVDTDDKILRILQESANVICAGSENVFVGSNDGQVHALSRSFDSVQSFKAHDRRVISQISQIAGTSLLLTIGEDLIHEPVLKLWALDKKDKKSDTPECVTTLSVQNGKKQFPISAFASTADLAQLAVGFANGAVTLIRGDLKNDRGAKQRTIYESEEPITGVEFREGSKLTTLYVSTTSRILTLVISGKGQGQQPRTLENSGCAVGCMKLDRRTGNIVVAREDAIYNYGLNGRGRTVAFNCPKSQAVLFNDYLAIVSPPRTLTSASKQSVGSNSGGESYRSTTLTIIDPDLRYIAFSEPLLGSVKTVFYQWGDLFVLATDGKLRRYHERPVDQRLQLLYKRDMYILAISLAQRMHVGVYAMNEVYRQYGDFLYSKGDYDTAMQQYLKAINNSEPSRVVRKYLDTSRINNLIQYLEELHDQDKANPNHTTLLLNCYAKLRDLENLDAFIKQPGDPKFDVDTAIVMCRQGGYYEQAAYLATRHGDRDLAIDILVEDVKAYAECLAFMRRLDPKTLYRNLLRYAQVLIRNCPEATTKLFIDYHLGRYTPTTDIRPEIGVTETTAVKASIFQSMASLIPIPYLTVSHSATPGQDVPEPRPESPEEEPILAEYRPPKPREAFAPFSDHPHQFLEFLETIAPSIIEESDRADVYSAMLELYLSLSNSVSSSEDKEAYRAKASALIEDPTIPISPSSTLLISSVAGFQPGIVQVCSQQGGYSDIFRSYASAGDNATALQTMKQYGPSDPELYSLGLLHFTSSAEALASLGPGEFELILGLVTEKGLMSPLQVVQALSATPVAYLGLIKNYLATIITREQREILQNRSLTATHQAEAAKKAEDLANLRAHPVAFQAQRCSACGGTLELPVIHFLCKHSFHQRCLDLSRVNGGEDLEASDIECPVCKPANDTVRQILESQAQMTDHGLEIFKADMEKPRNGLRTVAEWFGRGVMDVPVLD